MRYRAKLVALRSGLKAQVQAVMAKNGILPTRVEMFGPGGQAQLDALHIPVNFAVRIESLRYLVELYDNEVTAAAAEFTACPCDNHRKPLQAFRNGLVEHSRTRW